VRLSQLQDIGGVRVIVRTLAEQKRLADHAAGRWGSDLQVVDYVSSPKPTGYRAIHHVVKRSNRLTEVQIRTELQHEWADMIEQVGRDTGMATRADTQSRRVR
jgi:ppGpp synthetase/RelA/SpoT-type nucleotidyltranferase